MASATPEELEKKLKEIEKLAAQLGETFNSFNLRPVLDNATAINSTFNDLTRRVEELEDGSDYLVSNFKKMVGEIGKSNEGIKATQSGFKSLGSLAEQLVNYQRGYNNLSSEDLKKIENKVKIEKSRLDTAANILKEEEADLKIQIRQATARGESISKINAIQNILDKNIKSQKQINELVEGNNSDLIQTYNLLGKAQEQAKLFEKTMGLTGAAAGALKGILGTLGLGKISEALGLDKAFEAATEKAKELSNARLKSLADEKKLIEQIKALQENEVDQVNLINKLKSQGSALETLIANKKAAGIPVDDNLIVNLQNKLKANKELLALEEAQLSKNQEILKSEQDRLKVVQDINDKYSLFGDKFKVMGTYFKEAGKGLLKTFQDPLFYITQILEAFKGLDDGIGEFAKGMNLTYQDAAKLNNEFNNIANSSMDVAVTTKGIRDTMLAMGKAMGSNAVLNAQDAVTFTKLREQAGLTNDELAEMEKLSLATGVSLEKNVENTLYAAKTTALNNGVLLNEKQIMQEVAKASAATKLSLANNPEALAKAAAQAKALGMNLEQVNSIADKMLDIESSISNELEAELLTGKNLNLEQARLYALNNDMEGLSREIAKNFGSAAEFSKMNRLQQEAAAKAVGMSREELAKTLTDQEALKGYSGKQAEDAKAALEAARARGMSEAEIKKQGIDGLMKQQSIQDRFNDSIEKLKEIFVSLLAPLMPVLDIFTMILKPVGAIAGILGKIVGSVTGLVGGLLESKGVLITIASIATGLGVAMNYTAIQTGIISAQKKMSLMWDEQGLILEKGKAAIQGIQLGYQAAMGSYAAKKVIVEKGGLVRSIGEASMKAISSLASIPIVGWALGLAAAGTVAALGYKFMQGDDVVSPGYGKRTLMGPEGAIALNDKDTVIAGTNLFDKKGDDVVSEPGKITTFKKENEIKAPSGGTDMSAVIAKLDALTAAVQSFGTKPVQVAVTMDGKKVAEGLGNHATQLGTSANVGTSKVA